MADGLLVNRYWKMYATISTGRMFGRKNSPRREGLSLDLAVEPAARSGRAMRLMRIVAVIAYRNVKTYEPQMTSSRNRLR